MLFDDELEEPPDDPSQTPHRDGDETIIGWCRHPDFFSDETVYEEHVQRSAHRHEARPYVQLDPLVGAPTEKFPGGEPLLGTYAIKKAWECLKKNTHVYLALIMSILVLEEQFAKQCVPRDDPENPVVPQKTARAERMHPRNLDELAACGFMVPLVPPASITRKMRGQKERENFLRYYHVIRFCSLFTIPKSNLTERVILNGKPGNAILLPPPYFQFFSPETIVRILRALGTFTGFTLDIRHCFYRISMHQRMRAYYAINRGHKGVWMPTVVPMGSTFGPALGQTCTLAMIAYREPNEPDLGLRIPQGRIPSVLEIVDSDGQVIGNVMVCIDNIAVVCKDPVVTNKWFERLRRNAKALGIFPFKREERTHWSEACFQFIGLHYENGRWWHCADRMEKWRTRYGACPGEVLPGLKRMDPDTLQSLVGVLVWDRRLRVQGMREMREIFGIQRRALQSINPQQPTDTEEAFLVERWHGFLRNEPQTWNEEIWPPPHTGNRK